MSSKQDTQYEPPKVWVWEQKDDNRFASINRPVSGATHDKSLPRGKHPLQLYSLATPNGVKVTVMLEELLEMGFEGAEYDAFVINIIEGDQFGSGFVEINPNSKIPALVDYSLEKPQRVFESGAILLYLAEKFDALIPKSADKKAACYSWLFWHMGAAPILGGGFGHFYAYAEEKQAYPINRYTMEVKRQLDVLDKHLADNEFLAGDEFSIADIGTAPWYGALALGHLYEAETFLDVKSYVHVRRWAQALFSRNSFKRGSAVNRTWGDEELRVLERHSSTDTEKFNQD